MHFKDHIKYLQQAQSQELFDKAASLFLIKYQCETAVIYYSRKFG